MAYETLKCPNCRTERVMYSFEVQEVTYRFAYFFFQCGSCDFPMFLSAEVCRTRFEVMGAAQRSQEDLKSCGWRILDYWPKPEFRESETPSGVPEHLRTMFEHCQDVAGRGGFDLCILGLQRVLKKIQAHVSPDFKGGSLAWISFLIQSKKLTADLKVWAAELKLHKDFEGTGPLDAEELCLFVRIILDQLFGVRSRVGAYRVRRAAA